MSGSSVVKEEIKALETDKQGVISFALKGSKVTKGFCEMEDEFEI